MLESQAYSSVLMYRRVPPFSILGRSTRQDSLFVLQSATHGLPRPLNLIFVMVCMVCMKRTLVVRVLGLFVHCCFCCGTRTSQVRGAVLPPLVLDNHSAGSQLCFQGSTQLKTCIMYLSITQFPSPHYIIHFLDLSLIQAPPDIPGGNGHTFPSPGSGLEAVRHRCWHWTKDQ
jgi:hypothetical protein